MVTFKKLGKLGRWGNQLFQVAAIRLYAKKFGYEAAFPAWTGTEVFVDMPAYSKEQEILSVGLKTLQLEDMKSYPRWQIFKKLYAVRELYEHPKDNVDFYGYFQDAFSLDQLQRRKNEVLEMYTFKPEIEQAYKTIVAEHEPYIALHLRRGDFVKLGYALPSAYYHDVLKKIHAGRPIYVASDDPTIMEELKDLNMRTFQLANPLPQVPGFVFDFCMIKNAQTVVGCGSTFSWWAAYLGNKNDYWSPPLTHLWPKHEKPAISKLPI